MSPYFKLAMLFLLAFSVFSTGCATVKADPAQEYIDTEGKELVGQSVHGFFFMVPGQELPWVCRPQGEGIVECDSENKRYVCAYQDEPVYFDKCKEGEDEVPPGITIEPSVTIQ